MYRPKFIVFLALAILLTQFQCAAACARDLCSPDSAKTETVPPCHHHHDRSPDQAPGGCWHQALNPPATSPVSVEFRVPLFLALGFALDLPLPSEPDTVSASVPWSFFPPPKGAAPPAVLRI